MENREEVSLLSIEFIYSSLAKVAAWKSQILSVMIPAKNHDTGRILVELVVSFIFPPLPSPSHYRLFSLLPLK